MMSEASEVCKAGLKLPSTRSMGGEASWKLKRWSANASSFSLLTPPTVSNGEREAGTGPWPSWPYGKGRQPASTMAPGMVSAVVAFKYSHIADMPVSVWPVECTAISAGTQHARVLMAPGRKPAAVGLGGRLRTLTEAYLLRWPLHPAGWQPATKPVSLAPEPEP